jgi:signal transduction histidine kinase
MPPDKRQELDSERTGVGFRGMRERLRQFGGDLNIQSDSSGTLVTANIPLSPMSAADGSKERMS